MNKNEQEQALKQADKLKKNVVLENKQLGAQIKALRLSRNESQLEFGKNFFPSAAKGVVSRWESGKSVPSPERLAKIAEMSGKTVTELLNGTTSNVISQIAERLTIMVQLSKDPISEKLLGEAKVHISLSTSRYVDEYKFKKFAYHFLGIIISDSYIDKSKVKEKNADRLSMIAGINNCAREVATISKKLNVQPFQMELLYRLFIETANLHLERKTFENVGVYHMIVNDLEKLINSKIKDNLLTSDDSTKAFCNESIKIIKFAISEIDKCSQKYNLK